MKHLRQYIRQMLLENALGFAEEAGMLQSAGSLDKKRDWNSNKLSRSSRRKIKDLFRKHADHQWLADNITTIHWVREKENLKSLIGQEKDELSTGMSKVGEPVFWHDYGSVGLWVKGHISLAANSMNDLVTGYGKNYKPAPSDDWSYSENPTEEEYAQQKRSSGINKQPKDILDYSGDFNLEDFPYVLDAETWEDPKRFPNEALVDNWKAVGIILADEDDVEYLEQALSDEEPNHYRRTWIKFVEDWNVPIYDVNFQVIWDPNNKLTEERIIRRLIRQMLLEDPMGFVHDLAAVSDEFGEKDEEFFGGDPGKAGGRAIKRAFNANADHQWLSTLDTVHWVQEPYDLEPLIGKSKDELSTTMSEPVDKLQNPPGMLIGLWVKGRITLAANDQDQLYSGHGWEYGPGKSLGGTEEEVTHRDRSSGRNKRPTVSKDYSRYGQLQRDNDFHQNMARNIPYVLDQSTWHKGIAGETNEALVDNWKPIGIVVGKWLEPIRLSIQSLDDERFKDQAGVNAPGAIGKIFKLATELSVPIFDRGRNELWSPE